MEQGHEGAAACEPDRGLSRGVAATDDPDARARTALGLGRAGLVEDADAFVAVGLGHGKASVVGAR
jgi:hypothetical protein